MRLTATQAWLRQKPSKGRLASPQAFQQRTRSSTRAWPRWRSSRAAMSSPGVPVMKQVWRNPASMSNKVSWAPGWGRSRRQISRMSSGQSSRVTSPVSSMTSAPSRSSPSVLDAPDPVLLLGHEQGVSHRTADGKADRVLEVGPVEGLDEAVGGPGRVGPDQDRVDDERGVVALLVAEAVLGRHARRWPAPSSSRWSSVSFGAGVARPQHGGQGLVRWCRTTRPRG